MHLVTIIITCFNSQDTIERSVKSALEQDWQNIEIIVIDDCSTDESFNLLTKISSKESRITLLRNNTNSGYPSSLNKAISQSKGDFIAIFDDDDENQKDRISLQIQRIIEFENKNNKPLILCYSNRNVFKTGESVYDHVAYAIGRKEPEPFGEEVAEYIFGLPVEEKKTWGMFGSCTLMARKKLFEIVGKFDESFRRSAELDYAIRAAFKGTYFIAVNKSLISMHKTKSLDKAGRIPLKYSLKLRQKYIKYLKSRNFYNSSILISYSNFYLNKKQKLIGILFRILAFSSSPILCLNFLRKKFNNFLKLNKY